ncbi:FAD-dependent oxidoreductase [Erythrobacter sp. EC-HK427]|uniref:FAD-dependent oxidoreductase n=1 Tax=Erythrobacter sp. EC-HK427 TaxID=2038396 RepID=UPI00125C35C3|nr:NAD(P)/FAD-dependent oxidoreductase [Erythrobacter sp. EC-HK427]VVT11750.1 FAD-dependent oxidoreductase [Erythrobacter sp. EC-HK427]
MQTIDIGIAGCGISGLAAALLLHRQGHSVTLYERFAAPQPLGSGLMIQPTGMAVLDALGLAEEVARRGAPVDGLLGLNTEGEPVLEAAYADLGVPGMVGLGIHRASLFGVLYEAVLASGITVQTGCEVTGLQLRGVQSRLTFAQGEPSPPHDLLVDSLGVRSTLVPPLKAELPFGALWASVDWPEDAGFNQRLLEQRYERANRMVGLLPLGEGKAAFFWSLRGDEYAAWQARGMAAFRAEVLALWPQLAPVTAQLTDPEQLTFARYAHRTTKRATAPGIVHIGDSWHAASPQLGQGANMALLDAVGLARAVERSDTLEAAQQAYLALRKTHVMLYQWLTWGFTPPFQSASVWPAIFRDHFMAPASRIAPGPRLKAYLVAGLAGAGLASLGVKVPEFSRIIGPTSPEGSTRGDGVTGLSASSTSSRASAVLQS